MDHGRVHIGVALATLPLAVQTLQEFAETLENSDSKAFDLSFHTKPGEGRWDSPSTAAEPDAPKKKKKGDIIQVDFSKNEKLK